VFVLSPNSTGGRLGCCRKKRRPCLILFLNLHCGGGRLTNNGPGSTSTKFVRQGSETSFLKMAWVSVGWIGFSTVTKTSYERTEHTRSSQSVIAHDFRTSFLLCLYIFWIPLPSKPPRSLLSFTLQNKTPRSYSTTRGDWDAQDEYLQGYQPCTPSLPRDARLLGTQHRKTI